jgi:hypothetical protein
MDTMGKKRMEKKKKTTTKGRGQPATGRLQKVGAPLGVM